MAREYIVMGAQLGCDKGTAPSALVVLPHRTVLLNDKLQANMADCAPFVNVMPFVMCTSSTNPLVMANSGAPVPCTPTCAVWIGCKTDLLVNGAMALMSDDMAVCPLGAGKIEIKDCGQVKGSKAKMPGRAKALKPFAPSPIVMGEERKAVVVGGEKNKKRTRAIEQKLEAAKHFNNLKRLSRSEKGNMGEMLANLKAESEGALDKNGQPDPSKNLTLIGSRVTDKNGSGHKGFDNIYRNSNPLPNFVLEEVKFQKNGGPAKMSRLADKSTQMDIKWISNEKRISNYFNNVPGMSKKEERDLNREFRRSLMSGDVQFEASVVDECGNTTRSIWH